VTESVAHLGMFRTTLFPAECHFQGMSRGTLKIQMTVCQAAILSFYDLEAGFPWHPPLLFQRTDCLQKNFYDNRSTLLPDWVFYDRKILHPSMAHNPNTINRINLDVDMETITTFSFSKRKRLRTENTGTQKPSQQEKER